MIVIIMAPISTKVRRMIERRMKSLEMGGGQMEKTLPRRGREHFYYNILCL